MDHFFDKLTDRINSVRVGKGVFAGEEGEESFAGESGVATSAPATGIDIEALRAQLETGLLEKLKERDEELIAGLEQRVLSSIKDSNALSTEMITRYTRDNHDTSLSATEEVMAALASAKEAINDTVTRTNFSAKEEFTEVVATYTRSLGEELISALASSKSDISDTVTSATFSAKEQFTEVVANDTRALGEDLKSSIDENIARHIAGMSAGRGSHDPEEIRSVIDAGLRGSQAAALDAVDELKSAVDESSRSTRDELRAAIDEGLRGSQSEIRAAIDEGLRSSQSEIKAAIDESIRGSQTGIRELIESGSRDTVSNLRGIIEGDRQSGQDDMRELLDAYLQGLQTKLSERMSSENQILREHLEQRVSDNTQGVQTELAEHMHRESVKVYKNVQAATEDSLGRLTERIKEQLTQQLGERFSESSTQTRSMVEGVVNSALERSLSAESEKTKILVSEAVSAGVLDNTKAGFASLKNLITAAIAIMGVNLLGIIIIILWIFKVI